MTSVISKWNIFSLFLSLVILFPVLTSNLVVSDCKMIKVQDNTLS